GSYPGCQLSDRERLGEIVIGAGVETLLFVADSIFAGEKNYRRIAAFSPEFPDYIDALEEREVPVDDGDIVFVDAQEVEPGSAVVAYVHGIAFGGEPLHHHVRQVSVVFDQQYLGHFVSSLRAGIDYI